MGSTAPLAGPGETGPTAAEAGTSPLNLAAQPSRPPAVPRLGISSNGRYFIRSSGAPFFWLADTGWLLFKKLTREEAQEYLEDRRSKGFNVVQAMVIHDVAASANVYGHAAVDASDVSRPRVVEGDDPTNEEQYDYWDHVDYVVELAASKGIIMALTPVWGSNVTSGLVSTAQAEAYARWLADRYRKWDNIVWLNGGDVDAMPNLELWRALGETLHRMNPRQLVTFHPRGRMQSADWFHTEAWLAFNMFQSGHRTYEQDDTLRRYGEDNWRYVQAMYALLPTKPVLDGEPSYEDIPWGLHDVSQPRWTDDDVRRYAYWSVFAGACGFSYGHNSVMQFHLAGAEGAAFGAKQSWRKALDAPGAAQLVHLRNLMLSRPYLERVPNLSIVTDATGERYARVIATSGPGYALVYVYTGRPFHVNLGHFGGRPLRASWYDPRTGEHTDASVSGEEIARFDPPGAVRDGNDWVLVLDVRP